MAKDTQNEPQVDRAAAEELAKMLSRANDQMRRLLDRNIALAGQLEDAAALRISHMDSDSRVAAINEQRIAAIRAVAQELRKPV